ncbi:MULTISPECIES: hypothetical protein [unclassified Paenibacillus]|uniref:hypothetical protein n=1 Tax=unclassified Paenibacillus TaxID=185978 RepID=UPI002F411283
MGKAAREQMLKGEYKELYNRVVTLLKEDVQPGEERDRAISSMLQLLLEAEAEQRPVPELFPEGFESFYQELVEALPVYTRESRSVKKRKAKMMLGAAASVLCLTIVLGVLWQTGYIGMWREGIAFAAGSLDKYSYDHGVIDGEFEITIDLNDLDSNKGKVLYDKDGLLIDVAVVDEVGLMGGGYRIHFRSHGKYSLNQATLVSGNKHYATESRWYSSSVDAELRSEYNGKQYKGSVMGGSALNYKDGDMFSFYLFPQEAYKSGEVTLKEDGNVKVIVSNLSLNQWNKK